jgi:hypothetical protein
MSDMAELMSRLSSMKDSDGGGGSGGGGRAEGFHPGSEGSGEAIHNFSFVSSDGQSFGMDDKIKGLSDIFSPSVSLTNLLEMSGKIEDITFDSIEKFMPIAIKSKLAVTSQKNFLLGSLQPPHMGVGGIKSALGKRGGDGQEH